MTPQQISLARHALGLEHGQTRSYRNRYLAPVETPTQEAWEGLVGAGMALRGSATQIGIWYQLTRRGAEAVLRPGESLDLEDFPHTCRLIARKRSDDRRRVLRR